MLQRLPIALTQVTEGNNSENLSNEIKANCLFFVSVKKLFRKYTITQSNQCNYKNGYYIYEL